MTLTKKIIYAICADTYAAAVRAGKSPDEANDLYHEKFDELFQFIGGPEGWIDLVAA